MTLFSFSVFETQAFPTFFSNFFLIYEHSIRSGLHLSLLKCVEYLFTSSRIVYPVDSSFANTEIFTRVIFFKYSGIAINRNLRQPSHISSCVKKLRRLSFCMQIQRNLWVKQTTNSLFVCLCMFLALLHSSPFIFAGLLKNDFRNLRRGLSVISGVFYATERTVQQTA